VPNVRGRHPGVGAGVGAHPATLGKPFLAGVGGEGVAIGLRPGERRPRRLRRAQLFFGQPYPLKRGPQLGRNGGLAWPQAGELVARWRSARRLQRRLQYLRGLPVPLYESGWPHCWQVLVMAVPRGSPIAVLPAAA
jgi:hypothetical protein